MKIKWHFGFIEQIVIYEFLFYLLMSIDCETQTLYREWLVMEWPDYNQDYST